MSPTESSSSPLRTVAPAASSRGSRVDEPVGPEHELVSARGFLIQLVSREIVLGHHQAGWLRAIGRQLAGAGHSSLAAECVRLAADSWKQREHLVVLLHRLVARWNRGASRRIQALDLTEQPASKVMLAYMDANERALGGPTPTVVLAALAAVERMLAEVVPLALELVDSEAAGDISEALAFFRGRADRAAALEEIVRALSTDAPSLATRFEASAAEALASFTSINRESAEFGRQLVTWRTR